MPQVIRYLLSKGFTITEYFDKWVVMNKKRIPIITLTNEQIKMLVKEVPLDEISNDGKISFVRSVVLA